MLNCAELWTLTWTFMGSCLTLDVERAYKIEQRREIIKKDMAQKMSGYPGTFFRHVSMPYHNILI